MKMESERKTMTTTTTTTTTARRASKSTSGNAVQKTRISIGGVKGSRGSRTNVINEPEMSSKNHVQVVEFPKKLEVASNGKKVPSPRSCNSENATINDGQLQALEQQLEDNCNSDSSNSKMLKSNTSPPIQLLKKTRSQPLEGGSSTESCLRKAKSDNAAAAIAYQPRNLEVSLTLCDSDHDVQQGLMDKDLSDSEEFQDQMIDHSPSKMALEDDDDIEVIKKKKEVQEPSSSAFDEVNDCETEEKVPASSKEQNVIKKISDRMDDGIGVRNENENENESEQNKIIGKPDDNGGGDQLNEVDVSLKVSQIKSKRMPSSSVPKINPASTPSSSPSTSTAGSCKPVSFGSRSVQRPTSSSLSPQSTARKASFKYSNSSKRHPESHGKLQFLVDLVMWRDVSRSAFIFGTGTFIILSSSYAEDFSFSLISVVSYLTLAYLAIVFLCKSIVNRGAMDDGEVLPENYIWGEDEAIWFAKMILPYLNESFLKLRVLFSGDPAMTMKVSTLLFILARCGNSITVWKMAKLGFFGVFIIPKLCSSYSTQIIAYGNFWIWRFQDAWKSCLHKKVVAFVAFTMVWNFSSVVARAWAAFMLFVAFRYYHYQYTMSQDDSSEEQIGFHDIRIRGSARHRRNESTPTMTPLNINKEKKSF